MSDVRKVERPTRAKVDPLAEATKKWDSKRMMGEALGLGSNENQDALNNMFAPPQALNQATDRDKSPIEAALDSLESATHVLIGCISELAERLAAVSIGGTHVDDDSDRKQPSASCQMELSILLRRDDVLSAHDRLRGIIERLQL